MGSGNPHKKVDVAGTKDQGNTSQSFSRHHLCMMLEEWKLEHLYHVRLTAEEISSHPGFYDPVVEYMEQLENGNVWLDIYCKDKFICCNSMSPSLSVIFFVPHEKKWDFWDHLLGWIHWKSEIT